MDLIVLRVKKITMHVLQFSQKNSKRMINALATFKVLKIRKIVHRLTYNVKEDQMRIKNVRRKTRNVIKKT